MKITKGALVVRAVSCFWRVGAGTPLIYGATRRPSGVFAILWRIAFVLLSVTHSSGWLISECRQDESTHISGMYSDWVGEEVIKFQSNRIDVFVVIKQKS